MDDGRTRSKWDKAAANFDLMASRGPEKRWAPAKEHLFANMKGRILFLALGTGLDIATFPAKQNITAIDISPRMLEKAAPRVAAYDGEISAQIMDVHEMDFDDGAFDQIYTSCTFCSVPNPVDGLRSLRRVLDPDGELFMFEHTGSRIFPISVMMNLMTVVSRKLGPDMNRMTQDNVRAAGFRITEINHIFLDVVKTIRAVPE